MLLRLFLFSGFTFAQKAENKEQLNVNIVLEKNDKRVDTLTGVVINGYESTFSIEESVNHFKEEKDLANGKIKIIPVAGRSGQYLTLKTTIVSPNQIEIDYTFKVKKLVELQNIKKNGHTIQLPKENEVKFSSVEKMNLNELKVLYFSDGKETYKVSLKFNPN